MLLYRRLFQLHSVFLLVLLIVMSTQRLIAQDGAAFLAAGHLLQEQLESAIYPKWNEDGAHFSPSYHDAYCRLIPNAFKPCDEIIIPFVSPPPMLLPYWSLGHLPDALALFIIRLSSVVALIVGSTLVYRPIARSVSLSRPFVLTLFALLPIAINPIENGQNSPLLFALAACGPLLSRPLSPLISGLIASTLALICLAKLSPLLFIGLLFIGKQHRTALLSLALIFITTGLSLLLLPHSLYADFLLSSQDMFDWITHFPANTSIDSALSLLLHHSGLPIAPWFSRLQSVKNGLVLSLMLALVLKRTPIQQLWPLCWMLWLILIPLNWWHYYWVIVAGIGSIIWPKLKHEWQAWLLGAWISLPLVIGLPLVVQASPIAVYIGSLFSLLSTALCLYVSLYPANARPSESTHPAEKSARD